MANYYASARSNYFKVKDFDAFKKEMACINTIQLDIEGDGKVCILFDEGIEDWLDGETEIDWAAIFKKHLEDNWVAVFMEAGAEKLCYVNGVAFAYTWDGRSFEVSLNDIYDKVKAALGQDIQITEANY